MFIEKNDERRFVEIWLTQTEAKDPELRIKLSSCFADYKKRKYLVAVYESGTEELFENTKSLLLHQREIQAGGGGV